MTRKKGSSLVRWNVPSHHTCQKSLAFLAFSGFFGIKGSGWLMVLMELFSFVVVCSHPSIPTVLYLSHQNKTFSLSIRFFGVQASERA
jgi:F0F1-type ATP synthase membrane subunit a